MGDITWEYAVFRCVGNIDIFRKKNPAAIADSGGTEHTYMESWLW